MHKRFIKQFLKNNEIDGQIFFVFGQDNILKISGKYQYIRFEVDITLINSLHVDSDYIYFVTRYGKILLPRKKKEPEQEQKQTLKLRILKKLFGG
jgi:hypothetical protein